MLSLMFRVWSKSFVEFWGLHLAVGVLFRILHLRGLGLITLWHKLARGFWDEVQVLHKVWMYLLPKWVRDACKR